MAAVRVKQNSKQIDVACAIARHARELDGCMRRRCDSTEIPPPLCRQLAIDGRLVIPVGDADEQRLIRVVRRGADQFDEEDLGPVRFVPLIGEHGWARDRQTDALITPRSLPQRIADARLNRPRARGR